MRDLFRTLADLENQLIALHGVSLNEAMVLCSIGGDTLTASDISERTGLTASHSSKVIRSVEDKELLLRNFDHIDKRKMCFTLSAKGQECLHGIKEKGVEIPPLLEPLFDTYQ